MIRAATKLITSTIIMSGDEYAVSRRERDGFSEVDKHDSPT